MVTTRQQFQNLPQALDQALDQALNQDQEQVSDQVTKIGLHKHCRKLCEGYEQKMHHIT
jgi:hypothetical protein